MTCPSSGLNAFRIEVDGPVLASRGGLYGVGDVACRARADTLVEHRYASTSIGAVVSGVFGYASSSGSATATPGTIVLGNLDEAFACLHMDDQGNRRAVLAFDEGLLAQLADDLGCADGRFAVAALPPGRASAPLYGAIRRLARDPGSHDEAVVGAGCVRSPTRSSAATPRRCPWTTWPPARACRAITSSGPSAR
jgi:AraC family transcriptional regulator